MFWRTTYPKSPKIPFGEKSYGRLKFYANIVQQDINIQNFKFHVSDYNSDLRPILIIAYFTFFTLQVCKEIIEDTRSENRFSISYFIVFLWLVMYASVRLFLYTVSP